MCVPHEDDCSDAHAVIRQLWQKHRETVLGRIEILDQAAAQMERGALDPELRRRAEQEAHKLAGALGSFGYMSGSEIARELERLSQGEAALGAEERARFADLVKSLRAVCDPGG
jgi:HPt (histidine-containing phosphotransfer) domain-containing protein